MTLVITVIIAIILLASNFTIVINAQSQQQVTSQAEEIESGRRTTTISTPPVTTTFANTIYSFRVQVPDSWTINDLNNTDSVLLEESTQGYGMLAQLCPEQEQRQGATTGLSTNASSGSSSTRTISSINASTCLGAQDIIHIIRYPDLETRAQLTNNNITAYHLQKLQEVGYRGIQIVNSIPTTVNITSVQTNQIIQTVPAKFVEITYGTASAPNEIKRGYFILTATNATAPNLGTTKGYSVFYEGSSAVGAEIATTTTSASSSL